MQETNALSQRDRKRGHLLKLEQGKRITWTQTAARMQIGTAREDVACIFFPY